VNYLPKLALNRVLLILASPGAKVAGMSLWHLANEFFLFCFCGARVQTQGLTHARQELYHSATFLALDEIFKLEISI
jgi:hypothetical protein